MANTTVAYLFLTHVDLHTANIRKLAEYMLTE